MKCSLVAVLTLTLSLACFGQEFRGTLSGVVTDPTGATVAGAKVVATEIRTGVKTPTVSDSTGQYTIPFLPPGQYEIAANMQGFKAFVRKDLALGAGDHPVIDVRLTVGDSSQS